MAIGLAAIYEKLKELITITERVRENTEEIKELKQDFSDFKEEFRAFREESRLSDLELRGDIKVILTWI